MVSEKHYQKSLQEIAEQPDWPPIVEEEIVAETYIPSERDRLAGKWAVVVKSLDSHGDPDWDSICHVIPTFGKHHILHVECWCDPRVDSEKDQVIHEASQ
jgi:hypothetical protein